MATPDPRLAWAEATRFAAVCQRPDRLLRVAFELADDVQRQAFAEWAEALGLRLAPHYRAALQRKGCRYVCADLPADALAPASGLVHRLAVGLIGNAELAAPLGAAPMAASELDVPLMKPLAVQRMRGAVAAGGMGRVKGLATFKQAAPRSTKALQGAPSSSEVHPVMAVIDFGCAFAHPGFRRAGGGTRVSHLWDQGRSESAGRQPELAATWPWRAEATFGYGREATGARLDDLMASLAGQGLPAARWEEACYVGAALPELLEPWSHGTAVLGEAAAWPVPSQRPDAAPEAPRDAAADADIVFVQLPQAAFEDLSGGWVTTYLLDGIEYVLAKAAGRPVVINISIGTHGGPHDGGSLIEAAMAQLLEANKNCQIVLAAGNAADKLGHAMATIPGGGSASLHWAVPSGDPTQSFLECWYPQQAAGLSPRFEVRPPGAGRSLLADDDILLDAQGRPCAALFQRPESTAGDHSGQALLALAPTQTMPRQAAAGMGQASAGVWTVVVTNRGKAPLEVHAWVERDEPGITALANRPDAMLLTPRGDPFQAVPAGTLTGQATGRETWVVGGYELGDPEAKPPPEGPLPAKESGQGPARGRGARKGPDALAPSDRWEAGRTRGLRVLANRSPGGATPLPGIDSHGYAALRGTSLAAPWAARQIFNAVVSLPVGASRADVHAAVLREAGAVVPPVYWR